MKRFEPAVVALAQALRAAGLKLASAESCTGGLIAAACTALAGSSDWFERGFVTYSNAAKSEMLGVPAALIAVHGAVSAEVAQAMAEGALAHSRADLAVAVTGIAGPGGATPGKPVGTVWMAVARRGGGGVRAGVGSGVRSGVCAGVRSGVRSGVITQAELLQLDGDRATIRAQTVQLALQRLTQRATADR